MSQQGKKEIIESTGCFGYINAKNYSIIFHDDQESITEEELLKNKIVNIKIFSKIIGGKHIIIGLEYKMVSLFNGKEIVITHKKSENFDELAELKINSGEYLNGLIVRFPNNAEQITQLGFTTNKNKKIIVGEEEGELKPMSMNEGKNVIIGTFGYINENSNLSCIGCHYVSYEIFKGSILFRFFMLRHLCKKNEEFKKKIDEKYDELPLDFKYIWKFVNMPDSIFASIIGQCL